MTTLASALATATDAFDLKPFMVHEDDFWSCPCFSIEEPDLRAYGCCWRTDYFVLGRRCNHDGTDATGRCCVHVWGSEADARRLKELLDACDWYGTWSLTVEGAA